MWTPSLIKHCRLRQVYAWMLSILVLTETCGCSWEEQIEATRLQAICSVCAWLHICMRLEEVEERNWARAQVHTRVESLSFQIKKGFAKKKGLSMRVAPLSPPFFKCDNWLAGSKQHHQIFENGGSVLFFSTFPVALMVGRAVHISACSGQLVELAICTYNSSAGSSYL